jgi:non-canonical purine NTP pyrophosphatase (RdgB/HAM1 family)
LNSPVNDLIFVTGSEGKRIEAERILGRPLTRRALDLPEIQAIEVAEVARRKALTAFELTEGAPVMIEDTGLYIESWNGLPGALIRWFLQTVEPAGICRMLDAYPSRAARAESIIAVYDGALRLYAGEVQGSIAATPRGDQGFGWDTIFIPQGETRTFAEMSPEEKDRFSMRRIALEKWAKEEQA